MQQSWPLPTTNPEFSILECPGYCEYKIENWRLARDSSGRVINGASGISLLEFLIAAAILSYVWLKARFFIFPSLSAAAFYAWKKCNQVLSESIVVLPSLGVQLETRRGFPMFSRPIFTSRRFIPLSALQDVIINEGLRRWDVRYYLAFVRRTCSDDICLEVAYENILPYHNVLVHIYQSLGARISKTMAIRVLSAK